MYYTGIGSRNTPKDIQQVMTDIAKLLEDYGFTLRSGGAQGADIAFENGVEDLKEIYLPWSGFEGSKSNLIVKDNKAFEIAEEHHPYWHNLSQGARKLQARNSHQVLGQDLNTPSKFLLCWTKDGKEVGGSGQALRMAKAFNIPIFNLGKYGDEVELTGELGKFLLECVVEPKITVIGDEKVLFELRNMYTK